MISPSFANRVRALDDFAFAELHKGMKLAVQAGEKNLPAELEWEGNIIMDEALMFMDGEKWRRDEQ